LPSRQLVAAGEQVLDVPPRLACRVRLLQAGDTNNNDPSDALPVAVAALRSTAQRPVPAEDHAAVLKVRARRHRDLARGPRPGRLPAACRAAAWCPAGSARRSAQGRPPASASVSPPPARLPGLAASPPPSSFAGIGRLDAQPRATSNKPAAAVSACGTSLTGIVGVGPVIAGAVIGDAHHVSRFP
jgi:hypothetical protein